MQYESLNLEHLQCRVWWKTFHYLKKLFKSFLSLQWKTFQMIWKKRLGTSQTFEAIAFCLLELLIYVSSQNNLAFIAINASSHWKTWCNSDALRMSNKKNVEFIFTFFICRLLGQWFEQNTPKT